MSLSTQPPDTEPQSSPVSDTANFDPIGRGADRRGAATPGTPQPSPPAPPPPPPPPTPFTPPAARPVGDARGRSSERRLRVARAKLGGQSRQARTEGERLDSAPGAASCMEVQQ